MSAAKALATTANDAAPAVAQSEDHALLSMIERAARDPNVDVDKMERLFAMRERMAAQSAQAAYAKSMAVAQSEMPTVARLADNKQTGSKYAKLEHIAAAIKPIYTRHGFSLSFGTADCPNENERRITCVCRHAEGTSETHIVDVPFDKTGIAGKANKTDTHAYKSTLTYGRAMLTCMVFDVQTGEGDDDGNASGAGVITEDQCDRLCKLVADAGADMDKVLAFAGVESPSEIPQRKFSAIVAKLERQRGK